MTVVADNAELHPSDSVDCNLECWMGISCSQSGRDSRLSDVNVSHPHQLIVVVCCIEFISGLASESIRRSVVCLSKANQFLHPTVWGTIVSVFVVPVTAFLLLVAFWMVMGLVYQMQRPLRYIAQRSLLSLMALWYITSASVIKTTLSVVLCVRVYNDVLDATAETEEISYWAVDTSLRCFEGQHLMLVIWILPFVSIVYVGLLIAFISILTSPKELLDHPDSWVYRTTGFLYRGYGSGWRRYWEVAIVLRKAIIAFLVFCAHRFDSLFFITCLPIFIMLAMGLQIVVMPYREKFDALNRIDLSALFVSNLTILIAIMLKSEGLTKEWRGMTLSIICVVLNISTFLVFLCFLVKYYAKCIKLSMSECGTHIDADAGTLKILTIWLGCRLQSLASYVRLGQSPDESSFSSGV